MIKQKKGYQKLKINSLKYNEKVRIKEKEEKEMNKASKKYGIM